MSQSNHAFPRARGSREIWITIKFGPEIWNIEPERARKSCARKTRFAGWTDAVKRKLYVHGIHGSDVGDQSRRIFRVKQAVIIDTRHVKESGRLARMHGNAIHPPRDSRSVYVRWRDSRSTVPPQWQTISRVKSSLSLVQTMPMHNSSGPQKHRSAVCLRFRR